jgi:hypothetical protein
MNNRMSPESGAQYFIDQESQDPLKRGTENEDKGQGELVDQSEYKRTAQEFIDRHTRSGFLGNYAQDISISK